MKHKFVLGLSALALLTLSPAFAQSVTSVKEGSYTLVKSSIVVNGKTAYTPYVFAAKDPNSGVMTTFVPIWYLQQILNTVPVKNTWDGHTWHLDTTFGLNPNIHGKHGQDVITQTGKTLESGVPAFALKDPNSGKLTTFFGLYYAEKLFDDQGLPATWNGKTHVFEVKVPLPGQQRAVSSVGPQGQSWTGTSSTTWSGSGWTTN